VILGFNVSEDEEVKEMDKTGAKIIIDEVIYKLIEGLLEFQGEKRDEIKRDKLMGLAVICKLKVLPQHVFRNSHPAIFGVAVEAGKLKPGVNLIDSNGQEIAKVKAIQSEGKNVEKAEKGEEVAVSLPGITFDRQLEDVEYLYSNLSEKQFRDFKKNKELLTRDEVQALQKIAEIKRKVKVTWGV